VDHGEVGRGVARRDRRLRIKTGEQRLGNLTNKGGAIGAHTYGNYNYGTRTGCANTVVRPHAVYQVTVGSATRRYCYDANGNLTNLTISAGSGALKAGSCG
jgi:hypothetical protein